MAIRYEECPQCGKTITYGDECYSIPDRNLLFCSTECLKEWIMDDVDVLDSVVEDWMENNAECNEFGNANDYGVSMRDFI